MSVKHMAVDPALVRAFPTCGIQFRNLSKLHQHERKQHQGTVACQHCGKIFKNKVQYRYFTRVPDPWHFETDPIRILGSVHWITNPAPTIFVGGFQDGKKKKKFKIFLPITSSVGTVRLLQFSKIKKSFQSHEIVEIKVFLNFLLLVIEGSGFRSLQIITDPGGPKTYGSVSGSGSGTLLNTLNYVI